LERLYSSGKTNLVARVGRGGCKSHTSTKVATNEVLFGDWRVPRGEVHYWAFVSARKDEAEQRVVLIESFLRVLGVKFEAKGNTITLKDRPRGFKVFACNVGAVSGFRCIGYSADELAKWNVEGVNPSAEVCASLNAMTVTHPGSKRLLISSPLGMTDYHATRFERGDDETQMVARAATWEANPSVTEEQTHELEPDDRVWSREYAAVPGSGITDDWFGAGVGLSATKEVPPWKPWMRTWIALDPAFAQDRFGWAVCTSIQAASGRLTTIHEVGSWKPDRSPGEMAARVRSELCAKYGVGEDDTKRVFTDQYEGYSFTELARREGLFCEVVPWTGGAGETSKATRFKNVRMAMLSGEFRMPDEVGWIKRLRSVRGVLLSSGSERIEVPRTFDGHGDDVSAMVMAASMALSVPAQPVYVEPVRPGSPEWLAGEQARMREEAAKRVRERQAVRGQRAGSLEARIRALR